MKKTYLFIGCPRFLIFLFEKGSELILQQVRKKNSINGIGIDSSGNSRNELETSSSGTLPHILHSPSFNN